MTENSCARRYYIAGPMTGIPEFNVHAFKEAAASLRGRGLAVTSPHELHGGDTTRPWTYYLRRDLAALLDCDTVVRLPGWQNSRGVALELHVAHALDMQVIDYADLLATLRRPVADQRDRRIGRPGTVGGVR